MTTCPQCVIDSFTGQYEFLSNFYLHPLKLGPLLPFPSMEHAYQAAKTDDAEWQERIRTAKTPGDAKLLGRKCPMRPNFDQCRLGVMYVLLIHKFQDPALSLALTATGDAELIEGNTWGDRFWGVDGTGDNWLGRLLMVVRSGRCMIVGEAS